MKNNKKYKSAYKSAKAYELKRLKLEKIYSDISKVLKSTSWNVKLNCLVFFQSQNIFYYAIK